MLIPFDPRTGLPEDISFGWVPDLLRALRRLFAPGGRRSTGPETGYPDLRRFPI
jgi:hypothetical protein